MREATEGSTPIFPLQRARRAIVVVDVVESVRLMQQHEDDVIDRWRRFVNEVVSEVLPPHGGRLVKSLGDGMLLTFESVLEAIAVALEIHRRAAALNRGRAASSAIWLRAGAHVADVVVDERDIFGSGVNLAARFAALASAGETVVSIEVRDELVHGLHAAIEDMGEVWLKHLDTAVRAFRIRNEGADDRVDRATPAPPLSDLRPTIAVVPFSPRDGRPGADALGDAIAEDLIGSLSQSGNWRVLSRLSTAALRGHSSALEIAKRRLGATYLLTGTFAQGKSGDDLRVRAELTDAADGSILWSQACAGKVADLFAGDDALTSGIVLAVGRALISRELQRIRTLPMPSLATYSLYLGAVLLLHRLAPDDFQQAHHLLDHLAERVPRSPAPHALMAKWHILRIVQGGALAAADHLSMAKASANRATHLDPDNAFGLAVDGLVKMHAARDFDRARESFDRALAANPHEPYAWCFLSGLHSYRGDGVAAEHAAMHALELSPLDPTRYHLAAYAATAKLAAGKYLEAEQLADESMRLNRAHSPSYRILTIAQVLGGRIDAARTTAQRMLALEPMFNTRTYLERYPGRDGPFAQTYVRALREAGVPA